jgi:hypothetical protein
VRQLMICLMTFAVVLAATSASMAEEVAKLALLIGNKGYAVKVGALKNPHHDVDLVAAALKKNGFVVTVLKDADYRTMDTAIKRYVSEVRAKGKGALSFVYYSGHGVANPETQINYLIPVDIVDPNDASLWYQSFQQNDVIDKLSKQAPNATHYVVFDACRNELNLSAPQAKAIGAEKGFVPVQQTPGLLIAYATAQGKTAADTGDRGGPYARALAAELTKPGIEAVTMFRNVQIRVKADIGQDPWLSFPALPEVYLAGRVAALSVPNNPPPPAVSNGPAEVLRICREVETMTSLATLSVMERQNIGTPAGDCISARLGELKAVQAAAAKAASDRAREEAAERKRAADEAQAKAAVEAAAQQAKIAALPPPPPLSPAPSPTDATTSLQLARELQQELKRVGCDPGAVDGSWGAKARLALSRFAAVAKKDLSLDTPTADALQALRAKTGRVCPLQCEDDEVASGDRCVPKQKPPARTATKEPVAAPAAEKRRSVDEGAAPSCRSWKICAQDIPTGSFGSTAGRILGTCGAKPSNCN